MSAEFTLALLVLLVAYIGVGCLVPDSPARVVTMGALATSAIALILFRMML